uniref:Uncharacterized protein n=1 Tax=Glossina palpalis gambiensis TaxID=67801 RepID=A0A1B0B4U5_9MUSC
KNKKFVKKTQRKPNETFESPRCEISHYNSICKAVKNSTKHHTRISLRKIKITSNLHNIDLLFLDVIAAVWYAYAIVLILFEEDEKAKILTKKRMCTYAWKVCFN